MCSKLSENDGRIANRTDSDQTVMSRLIESTVCLGPPVPIFNDFVLHSILEEESCITFEYI